jgi:hypothetical protein
VKPHVPGFAILVVVLQLPMLALAQPETAREFTDLDCKIVLPGSEFKWLDASKLPGAKAAFGDASGTMLILIVQRAPPGFVLSEKGFDEGVVSSGKISILERRHITFRGVPCYEIHTLLNDKGSIGTIRAFCANGYVYQLAVVGRNLPIAERDRLESIFSAFQFAGRATAGPSTSQSSVAPTAPSAPIAGAPATTPASHAPSQADQSLQFSRTVGEIAGLCLIAIVILLVLKRRKEKQAS